MQNHTHSVLCASDAKVLNYPKFITILPQHNLTSVMNINKLVVNKSLQNLTNKYVVIFGSCNKPECVLGINLKFINKLQVELNHDTH